MSCPLFLSLEWQSQHSSHLPAIWEAVRVGGSSGAWARLERGELTLEQFYQPFSQEVSALGRAQLTPDIVRDFMENLVRGLSRTDPDMMEAVGKLKEAGIKLAVLTNNWKSENSGRLIFDGREQFDSVVESCLVGQRKPEPGIYTHTLDQLGVTADEAVFLDDLGHNLKAAEQLGIATIKVNDVPSALVQLQNLLNMDLGVTEGTSRVRKGMEIDQASLKTYLTGKLKLQDGKKTNFDKKKNLSETLL